MSDFRFSPRPNRAGEIGWMPWGEDAFARAAAEDKPILLSISAVWCHWCHVMDETSYSDAGVIETINRSYVPVRVDNDRRPDINARYNMGGWPTTAFLAPDGTTLTGATYLPPQQMRNALAEIARFYAERKDEIASRAAEFRARPPRATASGDEPSDAPIASLIELLRATFDEEYAGFGDAPKFPQPEVHEFLVAQWRLRGEPDLHDMAARTMLAMTRGAMYDHVEGGFFRYSTTRDWSVPHFEKMAEDHAGLLRVLAALVTFAPTDELRATLVSTLRYVRSVLYDAKTGFFAGSQDADESYFALPLEARRERGAPYVDQTSYTNWTCALAGACCLSARALDDDALLTLAQRTLDNVHELLLDEDGLAHHVLQPGGAPEVRGLFADQVAYARALLDAHEISGEARFLDRARTLCDVVIARFAAEGGAFYDRLGAQDALGRLALTDRPIVDNGTFADVLLRLAALMGSADYRERAAAILRFYSHASAAAGPFAATYARALQRYLAAEVTVRISGSAAATDAFREAALRLPSPFVSIRTLAPENETAIAYVCSGTTCGPPVREPAAIRSAYDALLP
ncbi:MAG: thioredoxin domain-containing protein [Candidatus Eremiobacteraeota bacterium]|nr:thioredoxin domain-containing protein [Candidatus Eremiobacteraeota bacterium]